MLKFLKNLFAGDDEEIYYECDTKITVNKKEGSIVIDSIRTLSEEEIEDIVRRYDR